MPNRFITQEELIRDLQAAARQQVGRMEVADCRVVAAGPKEGLVPPGIGGGLYISLVLACRERLNELGIAYETNELLPPNHG